MSSDEVARRLVAEHGRTFAQEAGIALADEPGPLWQLLVLSQLLSARIASSVAIRSAGELFSAGWVTPQALRASTWNARVAALGRGGYRRYDVSTATRLADNASMVLDRYDGDLRRLRDDASASSGRVGAAPAVARRLQDFAGIGPTGAGIFLREVQAAWPQVRPCVDALVLKGARAAGLPDDAVELAGLVPGDDLASLCAALVRVARRPSSSAVAPTSRAGS